MSHGLPRSIPGVYERLEALEGGAGSVDWADISGKPSTFTPTIGVTATTAMAGNKAPTSTQRGGVLQQAAIANAAAAPTQAEFNAVLTALRAAGVIAT